MEEAIKNLMDFVDASPTPFQAIDNLIGILEAHGAIKLDERELWQLEPGVSYYIVRGGSSLVTFRMGLKSPSECGFQWFPGPSAEVPYQ